MSNQANDKGATTIGIMPIAVALFCIFVLIVLILVLNIRTQYKDVPIVQQIVDPHAIRNISDDFGQRSMKVLTKKEIVDGVPCVIVIYVASNVAISCEWNSQAINK